MNGAVPQQLLLRVLMMAVETQWHTAIRHTSQPPTSQVLLVALCTCWLYHMLRAQGTGHNPSHAYTVQAWVSHARG